MSIHHSQSSILSWQKKLQPTHPVIDRLKAMTAELELIQNEICGLLGSSDGTPKKRSSLPDNAGADVMRFKTAVDQLRRTLWFYCDEDASVAPRDTESPLQNLTRYGQPGEAMVEIDLQRQDASFFDRLNLVIDGYIQPNGTISRSRRKIKL